MTLFGIYLPDPGERALYLTTSRVTRAFGVDGLEDFWGAVAGRFPQGATLRMNADNGSENYSRRPQCMTRLPQFADQTSLTVQLASYPPYHRKDHPIERVWGACEHHWNGSLLTSVDMVIAFAKPVMWRAQSPLVQRVDRINATGKRPSQATMRQREQRFLRRSGLERWFVSIQPLSAPTIRGQNMSTA